LFAESLKDGNQFIVETHSEHMVLRLQKLVRTKKLRPEDVAILYVSRGENGSTVKRLRMDEDGDFIDRWPDGFFTERLKEFED
jgi:predicted ATPase